MSAVLDEAGFTSVVATNCEQEYPRYLRPGEQVAVRASLEGVTGPKQTSLGEGWFVTTRSTWYVGTEPVATMLFRILKFRPATPAPAAAPGAAACCGRRSRAIPSSSGTAPPPGELRIQRCGACGALRHPPGPICPACGAGRPGYVVAAGTGEVYSYVVHHHPPVPGRQLPIVVALVAAARGRAHGRRAARRGPEQVRIGLPVRVEFVRVDDELTLPAWREDRGDRSTAGLALPELVIDVTPTFVISYRDRDPRLPGRSPRPGPGRGAGRPRTSSSTS